MYFWNPPCVFEINQKTCIFFLELYTLPETNWVCPTIGPWRGEGGPSFVVTGDFNFQGHELTRAEEVGWWTKFGGRGVC